MRQLSRVAIEAVDRFLFQSCDPRLAPVVRIAYAFLLIIYTLVWMRDAELWFTDAGVLTSATVQHMSDGQQWSLLFLLPSTAGVIETCLSLLLLHSVLLLLGCWSRVQIACIFLWLVSFQHRNPMICDGEDTVFRWFAFLMIFMPLDCGWSLTRRWSRSPFRPATTADAWALRLMQIEVTLIYASTAWNKLQGTTWQNGTALYYVSHMTDHFGRVPVPWLLVDSLWIVKGLTWSVLAIESLLPLALWWRPTRRIAVVVGIGLHLGIEATMHLFLFEWIMIVGLLSFVRLPMRGALELKDPSEDAKNLAQSRQKNDSLGTEYLTAMCGVSTSTPPLCNDSTPAMTMPEVSSVRSSG